MTNPELMAIGDSVYNGVRSLTIDRVLASHSVPAQVAAAFGWDFVSPDYPRPVLANLEGVFSDPLNGALNLRREAALNAHAWLAGGPWSHRPMFHNLAIAQQATADLFTANYAASIKDAERLATAGATLPLADLPKLYQAINTSFVLNPQRTNGDVRTPVDILGDAKPKRILVHVGANDGLWGLLLQADPGMVAGLLDVLPTMEKLAEKLAEKCAETEHFYINLFPKPSAIANLMPRTSDETPTSGYYDRYVGWLIGGGGISRTHMKAIDDLVLTKLNPGIRIAYRALGDRAHFVDLYANSMAYDRKNRTETKDVIVHSGGTQILLDNFALEILPLFGGRRVGVLFGLDNLHPSIVGYGVMAQAVCDTIAAVENKPRPAISLQACYDADSLLHNLPASIGLADFLLEFVGTFIPPGA